MKSLYEIIWDKSGTKKQIVWSGRKSIAINPWEVDIMLDEFKKLLIEDHCFDYASIKSGLYFQEFSVGENNK